ncbi:hypothetical protein [Rothia sp. 32237D007AR]
MKKKACCAVGSALALTLTPFSLLVGQVLTGPQSAFAAESATDSSPTAPVLPSQSPGAQGTVAPNPSTSPSTSPSLLPSADPAPAPTPSESAEAVVSPSPDQTANLIVTGGVASLPDAGTTTSLPAQSPTANPTTDAPVDSSAPSSATPAATQPAPLATPSNPVAAYPPAPPAEGSWPQGPEARGLIGNTPELAPAPAPRGPDIIANGVTGAQAPNLRETENNLAETLPAEATVLGIFSSSQQNLAYEGAPEWMEGFLNISAAPAGSSSSADPNQAVGVAGAQAQGHQMGAGTGGSIFQRGGTIVNGARPLLIFTGIATVGLMLVVFNFVWRNRAPKN